MVDKNRSAERPVYKYPIRTKGDVNHHRHNKEDTTRIPFMAAPADRSAKYPKTSPHHTRGRLFSNLSDTNDGKGQRRETIHRRDTTDPVQKGRHRTRHTLRPKRHLLWTGFFLKGLYRGISPYR